MPTPETGDDLALLLATEQRLERTLADIRAEGERMRAAAAEEVARADAEVEASIDSARRRMSEELAEVKATRIAAIEAQARAEIERWDRLRDDVLGREARRLAQRLVELAREEP